MAMSPSLSVTYLAYFKKGYVRPLEEPVSLSACWKYYFPWQAHQVLCCVFNATDHGWGGLSIPAYNVPVFCFSSFDVMSYFDVPMELRFFSVFPMNRTL